MRRITRFSALALAALAASCLTFIVSASGPALAASTSAAASDVVLTTSSGHDIFNDGDDGTPYSYGPSIIINSSTSADMWNCTVGSGGAWDAIRWRHSTDGGNTWGAATVVLTTTPSSADQNSVCDPGVIEFGGYYYISYTGTAAASGYNDVFVARGTSPSGPFSKWNGSGWGGNPTAMVSYTASTGYGVGEPSLVLLGNQLFVYYSFYDGTNDQTRVQVADATSANWPATLSTAQVAIPRAAQGNFYNNANMPMEDSTDIKYVDSLNEFIAVGAGDRWTFDSHVKLYASQDGIHFTRGYVIDNGPQERINNMGISGTPTGHLDTTENNFIVYAEPQNSNPVSGSDYAAYVAREHEDPISLSTQQSDFSATSFTTTPTPWSAQSGSWGVSGGAAHQYSTSGPAVTSLPNFVMDNGSYSTSVKLTTSDSTSLAGIAFDRHSAAGPYTDGYVASILANGTVQLSKAAVGTHVSQVVASASTGLNPTVAAVPLKVVKSDTDIAVYAGTSPSPVFTYSDPYLPFTGGGVALVTYDAAADFGSTTMVDNTEDSFADGTSWSYVSGTWSTGSSILSQTTANSSTYRALNTTGVFGDDTYQFDTRVSSYSDPNGFIGLMFDQSTPTDDSSASGYMVYLRASGNVGLYKAGVGVVSGTEVPSGATVVGGTGVHVKVIQYHINANGYAGTIIQVYVGQVLVPQIDYFDSSSSSAAFGYTSLATNAVSGQFANWSVSTQART
jgi:hypothetical protein